MGNENSFFKDEDVSNDHTATHNLNLLESGVDSDLILECGSIEFKVHSPILADHSEVLKELIDNLGDIRCLKVTDIESFELEKMLYFMYAKKLPVMSLNPAMKVYEAAENYKVRSLITTIANFIKNKLDENNVCEVLTFSDSRGDAELKVEVIRYLKKNMSFLLSKEWKEFCGDHPKLATEVNLQVIERAKLYEDIMRK